MKPLLKSNIEASFHVETGERVFPEVIQELTTTELTTHRITFDEKCVVSIRPASNLLMKLKVNY